MASCPGVEIAGEAEGGRQALKLVSLLRPDVLLLDIEMPGLAGIDVVMHCAGPFAQTSRPMADACLRTRVHYLDITGEIAVFEALAARDAEARARGVMLLPGVGFDVVPSDCLAAHRAHVFPASVDL